MPICLSQEILLDYAELPIRGGASGDGLLRLGNVGSIKLLSQGYSSGGTWKNLCQ